MCHPATPRAIRQRQTTEISSQTPLQIQARPAAQAVYMIPASSRGAAAPGRSPEPPAGHIPAVFPGQGWVHSSPRPRPWATSAPDIPRCGPQKRSPGNCSTICLLGCSVRGVRPFSSPAHILARVTGLPAASMALATSQRWGVHSATLPASPTASPGQDAARPHPG